MRLTHGLCVCSGQTLRIHMCMLVNKRIYSIVYTTPSYVPVENRRILVFSTDPSDNFRISETNHILPIKLVCKYIPRVK